MATTKFDGLARNYDSYRPRYPHVLIEDIKHALPIREPLTVADIGAGTGIALEKLIPTLGLGHIYYALDISSDMIKHGKAKFPSVHWLLGRAEEIVPKLPELDLILAAQSFQWMDRKAMLSAARYRLSPDGLFAVLQNNRDFANSAFLDEYESLLEGMSPGYSRHYRSFDLQEELAAAFICSPSQITLKTHTWSISLPGQAFVGMSRSSTQVQRALAVHGSAYMLQLNNLIDRYQQGGKIELRYESQLFLARKQAA